MKRICSVVNALEVKQPITAPAQPSRVAIESPCFSLEEILDRAVARTAVLDEILAHDLSSNDCRTDWGARRPMTSSQ